MSFTFSNYQSLLIPLLAVGAYLGWQRGFWREVGITGGIAFVVMATVLFPEQFIGFINRIVANIPRVFGLLLGADTEPLPADFLFGPPDGGRFLLTRIALFGLLTFLVYTAHFGWAYEGGKPRFAKTAGERALGGLFGAITGLLWFTALNNFLDAIRNLRNTPVLPGEGTTLTIPTLPDVAFLIGFVPTIIAILIIILLVLAALRLPRLWR
ncbi:MAG TPA: hypothetical protein VFS21_17570 [Roseiflexaceae bacterium]|nr:hypothetical protein [Roseiflexaceae bacterium]